MEQQPDKELAFFEAAYKVYTSFPEEIQSDGGYQLHLLQTGKNPADFKPLTRVGSGAYELRLDDELNEYRVVYVAKLDGKVWVLHAFQKKTRATRAEDIDVAKKAYAALERMLLEKKASEKKRQRGKTKNE